VFPQLQMLEFLDNKLTMRFYHQFLLIAFLCTLCVSGNYTFVNELIFHINLISADKNEHDDHEHNDGNDHRRTGNNNWNRDNNNWNRDNNGNNNWNRDANSNQDNWQNYLRSRDNGNRANNNWPNNWNNNWGGNNNYRRSNWNNNNWDRGNSGGDRCGWDYCRSNEVCEHGFGGQHHCVWRGMLKLFYLFIFTIQVAIGVKGD
jgi:hypothetical protein